MLQVRAHLNCFKTTVFSIFKQIGADELFIVSLYMVLCSKFVVEKENKLPINSGKGGILLGCKNDDCQLIVSLMSVKCQLFYSCFFIAKLYFRTKNSYLL